MFGPREGDCSVWEAGPRDVGCAIWEGGPGEGSVFVDGPRKAGGVICVAGPRAVGEVGEEIEGGEEFCGAGLEGVGLGPSGVDSKREGEG